MGLAAGPAVIRPKAPVETAGDIGAIGQSL
jgi:hypothetical protein